MDGLLLATGFTGALTLVFLLRGVYSRFVPPPSAAAYFSPQGGCTEAVVRELRAARHEILVQAFSFTSDPITNALVDAKKRGVDVKILLDPANEDDRFSDLRTLLAQGLAPLTDAEHALAHNKVMVIDRRTVITGSFNFTNQAERENAENLLVLKDHRDLAAAYRRNFEAHRAHARPAEYKADDAKAAPRPAA
jgi:phosphatidylserine/phosphatidylglycerophosphate/cardiolipin synthase-like enzyme